MRGSLWFTMLLGALVLAPAAAGQDAPVAFGGDVAVVSDYTFRGISQTSEEMAIQGGITASVSSGLYLGVWGSSLNFGEADLPDPTQRAHAEIDVVGGLDLSMAGTGLSVGFTYYGYPGTNADFNYNFLEFSAGLSRDFTLVSAGVSAAYSPDYFAASGTSLYVSGSLDVSLPATPLALAASLGYQRIERNSVFGTPNYMDWSAGATLDVWGLSLGATLVGTDVSSDDCFGGSDLCDARVVLSAGLSM